jgi:hypothetical protein
MWRTVMKTSTALSITPRKMTDQCPTRGPILALRTVGYWDKPVFQPRHNVTAVKPTVDTEILAGYSPSIRDPE